MACTLLLSGILAVAAAVPAAAARDASQSGAVRHRHLSFAMLVSPPRLIVAASQIAKTRLLEIENRGTARLNVHVRVEAVAQRKDGSALLEPTASYSAVHWVRVMPSHFLVNPRAKLYIKVRFRVPLHPEPGDHDIAIIFLVPPRPGKGNIHIAEGIGVPTLITVPGRVIDNVSVTSLKTASFSSGGPISLTATVRESGDVHHSFAGPHGRLEARVGAATILFPPITVLRESTVTVKARWENPPLICVCHVTAVVMSHGSRTVATATVVTFPAIQILIGIAAIVTLGLVFRLARRHQRRRLTSAYQAGLRLGTPATAPPGEA